MPVIQTTLVRHFKQEGNNAKGPWTRHDFKDADGNKYQTFKNPLANLAYGLLNKPALITYEDEARGDYTNRVIKGIEPVEVSQAPSVAPTASQGPSKYEAKEEAKELNIQRQSAILRVPPAVDSGLLDGEKGLYVLAEELLHFYQTGEYPGKPQSNEQAVLAEFASQFPDAA